MNAHSIGLYHLVRSKRRSSVNGHDRGQRSPASSAVASAPTTVYVICTNPRSGSWLLSEGLASTSLAGNPREWFNPIEEQQHRARWRMEHSTDLDYPTYLALVRSESTSNNGISGTKLHYYQFAGLPAKLETLLGLQGLTSAQLMSRLFPQARYIWLKRRDKARQAISFQIASLTGQWWDIDGTTAEAPEDSTPELEFDPHAVARSEQLLVEHDANWQAFFNGSHIDPLVIHYEDVAANYEEAIVGILRWLGVPGAESVRVPPPRLRRQSTERNEDWLARYKAFKTQGGNGTAVPGSNGKQASLPEQVQKSLQRFPLAWKQWIAQSKLQKASDEEIIAVLENNGYDRKEAAAEVKKVALDPFFLGSAPLVQRLGKAASQLNILGELARLSSKAQVVERRSGLSRDEFRDQYYAANRPVILQHLMSDWKAMTAWTPDFLKGVIGECQVEVMTGREADSKYEQNAHKHRTKLRFADYVDRVYSGKVTNDYYMVATNGFLQLPQARPLLRDFTAFPQYLKPVGDGRQCYLWFGPAGTVTPLHHDTSNILMAQVAGRKRYRLIPVLQRQYVYNACGVFSDVDCENPNFVRHPKFREATVLDIVVHPGEVLFMPVGWWHHVRALDVCQTIAFTNFLFPNHFTWA